MEQVPVREVIVDRFRNTEMADSTFAVNVVTGDVLVDGKRILQSGLPNAGGGAKPVQVPAATTASTTGDEKKLTSEREDATVAPPSTEDPATAVSGGSERDTEGSPVLADDE